MWLRKGQQKKYGKKTHVLDVGQHEKSLGDDSECERRAERSTVKHSAESVHVCAHRPRRSC
jgi:hypothetical protein